MKAKYSLVVPCYNEHETVELFYNAVTPVMETLKEPYEIIFVNDGSRDNTLDIMRNLSEKDKRVKVLSFSRNFGQQASIFCGLANAQGDAVISMDVDLQHPIETVLLMIEKWKEGYEIVHGKRVQQKGVGFFKKITSKIYLGFLKRISGLDIPKDVGEFKLFDRKVVDTINAMPEYSRYLRGLTAWIGYKQTFVEFECAPRVAGTTKWNFKKLVRLAIGGVISYSTWPLTRAMRWGIELGFLSFVAFAVFTALAVFGPALPLIAWLFPTITMSAGVILVALGCSNIYIKRIYEESQNRPRYIVSQSYNFEKVNKN
jgi:dolichol-phosphate mannosyltransferase